MEATVRAAMSRSTCLECSVGNISDSLNVAVVRSDAFLAIAGAV